MRKASIALLFSGAICLLVALGIVDAVGQVYRSGEIQRNNKDDRKGGFRDDGGRKSNEKIKAMKPKDNGGRGRFSSEEVDRFFTHHVEPERAERRDGRFDDRRGSDKRKPDPRDNFNRGGPGIKKEKVTTRKPKTRGPPVTSSTRRSINYEADETTTSTEAPTTTTTATTTTTTEEPTTTTTTEMTTTTELVTFGADNNGLDNGLDWSRFLHGEPIGVDHSAQTRWGLRDLVDFMRQDSTTPSSPKRIVATPRTTTARSSIVFPGGLFGDRLGSILGGSSNWISDRRGTISTAGRSNGQGRVEDVGANRGDSIGGLTRDFRKDTGAIGRGTIGNEGIGNNGRGGKGF
ncbi:uncharacterized protein LOC134206958 [Armigeres subalbatus]|uniref:uncharacterized protein LOC134206958 n=1 Tax=Armigeres subalbatus TaxID=124917 RepID=UPI002ED5361A